MRLAVILILSLLSGCAGLKPDQASNRTGSLSADERETLYQQAREGAQQSREQYIATTRPALQRKFRQEYPAITDADLDLLVNDALEKGVANGGWATTRWSHQAAPNGLHVFLMEEFCFFELLLANVVHKD